VGENLIMPDNLYNFYFDPNFNIGTDSVFAYIDRVDGNPPLPPVLGYFLLLNTQDFLLLNGQNLALL